MSEITPIARIYTQFTTKFGIPRQSGLVEAEGKIIFEKEFRSKEAVRGLECFSHLWLIWEFTQAKAGGWSPTVRPPRLGGNKRVGVFATRSPFRPNSLGLSSVKLDRIDLFSHEAPVIYVSGADILDGTPIFDIKPYLPFTDSHPQAQGGFADELLQNGMKVIFQTAVPPEFEREKSALIAILENNPRPAYQNDKDRVYSFEFSGYNIKFSCDENSVVVLSVKRVEE